MENPDKDFPPVARKLKELYPKLTRAYKDARDLIGDYPDSDGARVLREMLELGQERQALDPSFQDVLERDLQ
jgi:hypothetical protein